MFSILATPGRGRSSSNPWGLAHCRTSTQGLAAEWYNSRLAVDLGSGVSPYRSAHTVIEDVQAL